MTRTRRPARPPRAPTPAAVLDPAPARRLALLLAALALAALLLPRLAGAGPLLAAPVELVASGRVARVLVETTGDRSVVIEYGTAPYATRSVRTGPGRHHAVALRGLEPGGVYVYRVRVDGVAVSGPRPFVMPGAAPRLPLARASHPM